MYTCIVSIQQNNCCDNNDIKELFLRRLKELIETIKNSNKVNCVNANNSGLRNRYICELMTKINAPMRSLKNQYLNSTSRGWGGGCRGDFLLSKLLLINK